RGVLRRRSVSTELDDTMGENNAFVKDGVVHPFQPTRLVWRSATAQMCGGNGVRAVPGPQHARMLPCVGSVVGIIGAIDPLRAGDGPRSVAGHKNTVCIPNLA